MSVIAQLRFQSEPPPQLTPEEATPPPKVFVRTFLAPPGWPWEQRRMAELDARHGAPVALSDVAMRLQATEVWRPGQSRRYGAFYVRRAEVVDRLETEIDLAGRPCRVVFLAPGHQRRMARNALIAGGAACAVVALISVSLGGAWLSRQRAEARLEALEVQARAELRQARTVNAQRAQAEALDEADRGESLGVALNDLAWASAARAPDARIEAWRWEKGLMAVEARGEVAPFVATDRMVARSPKPLRRRVWLWGVGPAPRTAPVSAAPLGGR
ncbi:MAG: hypothetical protein J7521_16870 [Caulobacter sp.]|nr:hypothetical protein [Caulobacter sp.]